MSDSIVIIPTYNEKENIEKIIRAVLAWRRNSTSLLSMTVVRMELQTSLRS